MKAIIFDLGGVCLTNYWGKRNRLDFSKKFNLDYNKINEYHMKTLRDIILGKITEEEYFNGLFKHQDRGQKTKETINYLRKETKAFQEVLDFIKTLAENYKIYAFTNEIKEAAEFRIKKFNLSEYFKKIFISSIVGLEKYDKEAYEHIVKDLGMEPSEIIFIDNAEENVKKAEEAGMKGILFNNLEQLKTDLNNVL